MSDRRGHGGSATEKKDPIWVVIWWTLVDEVGSFIVMVLILFILFALLFLPLVWFVGRAMT